MKKVVPKPPRPAASGVMMIELSSMFTVKKKSPPKYWKKIWSAVPACTVTEVVMGWRPPEPPMFTVPPISPAWPGAAAASARAEPAAQAKQSPRSLCRLLVTTNNK